LVSKLDGSGREIEDDEHRGTLKKAYKARKPLVGSTEGGESSTAEESLESRTNQRREPFGSQGSMEFAAGKTPRRSALKTWKWT